MIKPILILRGLHAAAWILSAFEVGLMLAVLAFSEGENLLPALSFGASMLILIILAVGARQGFLDYVTSGDGIALSLGFLRIIVIGGFAIVSGLNVFYTAMLCLYSNATQLAVIGWNLVYRYNYRGKVRKKRKAVRRN